MALPALIARGITDSEPTCFLAQPGLRQMISSTSVGPDLALHQPFLGILPEKHQQKTPFDDRCHPIANAH
jgi:hypothetical protein